MEKKIYTQPELEVIRFETEDVITTSDATGTGWDLGDNELR